MAESDQAIRIVYILSHPAETEEASTAASTDADANAAVQLKGVVTLLKHATKPDKVTYAGRLRALRALVLFAPKHVISRGYKDMCDQGMPDLMRHDIV